MRGKMRFYGMLTLVLIVAVACGGQASFEIVINELEPLGFGELGGYTELDYEWVSETGIVFKTERGIWLLPDVTSDTPPQLIDSIQLEPNLSAPRLFHNQDGSLAVYSPFSSDELQVADTANNTPLFTINLASEYGTEQVVFSGDNRIMATVDRNNQTIIQLWDTQAGHSLGIIRQPYLVDALALNETGSKMASIGVDGSLYLWDVIPGFRGEVGPARTIESFIDEDIYYQYQSMGFSPDENLVVADFRATVRIYDMETDMLIATDCDDANYTEISPSFNVIVCAVGNEVLFVDLMSGESKILEAVTDAIERPGRYTELELSEDNTTLYIRQGDHTELIDIASDSLIYQHDESDWYDDGGRISPDGSFFGESTPTNFKVYNSETGETLFTMDGIYHTLAYSPDGDYLVASGRETVYIWQTDTPNPPTLLPFTTEQIAFHPGGSQMAMDERIPFDFLLRSTSNWQDSLSIQAISLDGGDIEPLNNFASYTPLDEEPRAMIAYDDTGERIIGVDRRGNIQFWDVQTGALQNDERDLSRRPVAYEPVLMDIHPDTMRIAYMSDDKEEIIVDDLNTGEQINMINTPDLVLELQFSPSGEQIATVVRGSESKVTLWNIDGNRIHDLSLPENFDARELHQFLAFSLDGQLLALATGDFIRIWEVKTGAHLDDIDLFNDGSRHIAFDPRVSGDRWRLTLGDALLQQWEIAIKNNE